MFVRMFRAHQPMNGSAHAGDLPTDPITLAHATLLNLRSFFQRCDDGTNVVATSCGLVEQHLHRRDRLDEGVAGGMLVGGTLVVDQGLNVVTVLS